MHETSSDAQGTSAEPPSRGSLRGFQARISWRGDEVRTLADIPPSEGGVVLVGINPSPISVNLGHYYQGTLGKRLWSRLESFGLLPNVGAVWEDERWQAAGNGLSDVVKRPTASASEVSTEEMATGAEALRSKLRGWKPGLIIFPFLASAQAVLGFPPPVGRGPEVGGVQTFRMEGPYAAAGKVERNGKELSELVGGGSRSALAGQPGLPTEASDAPSRSSTADVLSQPVTAADRSAGRIRFPRPAKRFFPAGRATVTVVLHGMPLEARYDPRTGPDRERSAVLSVGRQALVGIGDSERLRVTIRPTDGLVSLD